MAVQLTLTSGADAGIIAQVAGEAQPLTTPTPLATLARIEGESNPYTFDPFGLGLKLYQAMGSPSFCIVCE
jgi:hypothetical protein